MRIEKSSAHHQKILTNPKNGFFKGVFSLVPMDGSQLKLLRWKFG